MFGNIDIINETALERLLQEYNENRIAQISSKDFQVRERKTRPLPGFEFPEKFPWCCITHRKILDNALDHFLKFPNCCGDHRKLKTANWFKKSEYAYIPIKSILVFIYTCHCIESNIDKPDWLQRITDYIEYTNNSFGQFPEGYGAPLGIGQYIDNIKNFIHSSKNLPIKKRKELLNWFEEKENVISCKELIDLPLLIKKYKEWLQIFPFELSMFATLKSYFTGRIPILKNPVTTNMYTGMAGSKILSYEELMDFLLVTTKAILKQINLLALYKDNNLPNPDKTRLEIAVANREISLLKYDTKLNQDTLVYRKVITDWLNEEKEFLNEVIPVLKKKQEDQSIAENIIDGIQALQWEEEVADCIINIRNNGPAKEAGIRNFFRVWMKGRYPGAQISSEDQRGKRFIDLMISHQRLGEKIIEFKGWWNQTKNETTEQICSYLTDAHPEGYIIMINDNKTKSIQEDYMKLVTVEEMYYIPDTWVEHPIPNTQMAYYESKHRFNIHLKTIYHFIINVYF